MLDNKFYEGYEGEGEVKIWYEENGDEDGLVIWDGYFNTILEGCFYSPFSPNGILQCYFNDDGFYDDKWAMEYPYIVLEELERFDPSALNTRNEDIIKESKEVIEQLVSFINLTVSKGRKIYIEYN